MNTTLLPQNKPLNATPRPAGKTLAYLFTKRLLMLLLVTVLLAARAFGQAPTFSYSSPQSYVTGTAISLAPTSSNVAAQAYNATPITLSPVFQAQTGIATDAAGNVYVANTKQNDIIEIPAGNGTPVALGSGFNNPQGVAVDAVGNVYVADWGNSKIKEIPAGNGTPITLGSGFNSPEGVAVDAAGNVYVADYGNNAVKEIPAGNGAILILESGFSEPTGVAVDAVGNVYVAYNFKSVVHKIPAGGGASVTIGSGFAGPWGVAVDAAGNLYVADSGNHLVKEVLVGGGAPVIIGSGYVLPVNVAIDFAGNVYVADQGNSTVEEFTPLGGYYTNLPAGLIINSNTGVISGIPTTAATPANYTVTAYNSAGLSATAIVNIGVTLTPPTTPATGLVFTGTTVTATTANWTNGNGTSRAVFMAAATNGSPAPVNLTAYAANAAFGTGTQIGSTGWYCVYNGTGSAVNITGLKGETTYQAIVVEYNGTGSNVDYLTTAGAGNPAGVTTVLGPPAISSVSPASGPVGTSVTINGSQFNPIAANNIVFFGATMATVTAASSTSLTVTVPSGATYAPITVLNGTAHLSGSSVLPFVISFAGARGISTSTFSAPKTFATGTAPAAVAIADIDGDGKPDIVVVNKTDNTMGVFLNTSASGSITSASFAAQQTFSIGTGTGSAPAFIAIGDLDGDGKPDVVTGEGLGLSVFHNTSTPGNISFATHTNIATSAQVNSLAIADFDGDGEPDIAVGVSGSFLVLRNTTAIGGIISFAAARSTGTRVSGSIMLTGDFDGDGKPDIIAIGPSKTGAVFHNTSSTGSISFASGASLPIAQSGISSAAIGDVDGDGKLDIVTVSGNAEATMRNTTAPGGAISFDGSQFMNYNTITPNSIAMNDLDGDGKPDLIIGCTNDKVLLQRNTSSGGSPSFAAMVTFNTGTAANALNNIAIGDLNGDGEPDIVAVAMGDNQIDVLQNNTPVISANGTPAALSITAGTASSSTTFNISGVNLINGNLTVTAPAGFDVSADNATWSASGGNFTIAETGTLASTPVYIRLDAADAANSYSGNVAITGGGAALVNVAVPASTVSIPPTTVVSITPVSTSPTNATTLDYTVTFATALTTPPSTGDFYLTGSATGTIHSVTGSGTTFDVNVTNVSGNGSLELDMTGGSDALPTISNVPFTGGAYTIDQTAPTANTITFASNDANGTAAAIIGDQVRLSFAVSEAVQSPVVTIAGKAAAISTTDNITYTATYTLQASDSPDGSGNVPYTIALTDLAGNTANYSELTTGVNVAFNNTPTIAATGTTQALSTTAGTASASTSFSVSGFNLAAGILVTPPAGFEVSTDGNNFSSTVIIGAAGVIASTPVYVRLAAADAAGNYSGNIALTSAGATEADVPTVSSTVSLAPTTVTSINPVSTSPTNAATLDYTVTFATALTTPPSIGDFTLSGAASGTVNTITGSGTTYDVNVTNVSGNGTLELDMTGGSDALPIISNVPFTGGAYTIDQTAPTVQSITATTPSNTNPTNATSVTYTVTFSEPVTGVDNSDFTFTSGGASPGGVNVTPVSSSIYLVSVSGISGNGALRLDLKSSGTGIADLAGNPILGGFTGGDIYTFDHTAPTVSSITAATPSNASPTNATSVTYTVTFSEAVTGVDATDFAVTSSGTSGAVTGVSGSGSTYTVTVSAISGNGTLRVDLNSSGDAITDAAGNTLTSGFTGGDSYTIDNTAPSLVGGGLVYSSSNANANYAKTGDVITLLFGANEALQTPTVTIAGHSITAVNTGGNNYSASYTMTSGDTEGRIPFNLTVTDLAGNSGNYTDVAAGDDITFDMTPPTVMISAPSVAGIGTGGAGTVTYTVTYADANFNTSTTPAITLIKTNTATGTVNISGSGTSYTVTISGITGSGTLGISVGAGYASDLAGNIDSGTGPSATFNVVLSSDATLSSLIMSKGALSPVFSTSMTGYTATVANGVTALTITPIAGNSNATILINNTDAVTSGAASGPVTLAEGAQTVINTVVTAQDGTTKTYTVTVTRAPSGNANLSTIGASAGPITPALSSGTSYALSVSNTTASMTIKPVTGDPNAKMKINGTATTSGTVFGPVALTAGVQTVISIAVTAQDGSTTKTYMLTVTRALSGNANLSSLKTGTGNLAPTFSPAQTSYTESVINAVSTMTITPTATDANATIKVNGTPVTSGTAFGPVTLAEGTQTVINTAVTAPDGTTKTYMVTVTRAPSTNDNLSSIGSGAALTPGFSSGNTSYTASVSNATATMTVKPVTSDPNAKMQINGMPTTSGTVFGPIALTAGAQTVISIAVMAQDGIANKAYTLTVTRAAGGADSYDPGISVTKPTETPTLAEDGIQVHQGISPNGDGINDFLQIDNISQYPDNKLSIMNRNGQLIYETRGYDNSSKVFDGHSNKNGQMQLPGTYFYQLDYTANGIAKHKTGFIVLKY